MPLHINHEPARVSSTAPHLAGEGRLSSPLGTLSPAFSNTPECDAGSPARRAICLTIRVPSGTSRPAAHGSRKLKVRENPLKARSAPAIHGATL